MAKTIWTLTDSSIINPESVYYSTSEGALFVSNVVGGELDKDGQGWISKLSPTGEIIQAKWVEGLNAPHGMRSHQGMLWVADIDELVGIDLQSGTIQTRIPIPGAVFLNDVAISRNGQIFVSDTLTNRIYRVDQGVVTTFAAGRSTESPNGMVVVNNQLVVASWGLITDPNTFAVETPGTVFRLDLQTGKKRRLTNESLGNLDGIEPNWRGNFLVSDYVQGKVFLVNSKTGDAYTVLSGLESSADIALIPESDVIVVPSLTQNTIAAYDYHSPLVHRSRGSKTADRLRGAHQTDLLIGLDGDDRLIGRAGSDELWGNQGSDRLYGQGGADRLYGGQQDDWLDGGRGRDTLTGSQGADIFVVHPNQELDIVTDFQDGIDRLQLRGGLTFEQLTLVQQGSDTLIQSNGRSLMRLQAIQADGITAADLA